MRTRTLPILLVAMLPLGSYAADFTDTAEVISATPIYQQVSEPRQECWTETTTTRQPAQQKRSYSGAVIGGIAGAILGNQVGGGSGKNVATAAGAIGGAIVGDRIDNDGNQTTTASSQPVQRCRTIESSREELTGYDVVYRYRGHDIRTTMPYKPGSTIQVGITALDARPISSNTTYPENRDLHGSTGSSGYRPAGNNNYDYRF